MRISVQWLTGNDNKPKGLWPIEWLAITYSILTTLAMSGQSTNMAKVVRML